MTSNRKSKKLRKSLINKKAIEPILSTNWIGKYAIEELERTGLDKKDPVYKNTLESLAVLLLHDDVFGEINALKRLCDYNILSPIRFTEDEWIGNKHKYQLGIYKTYSGDITNTQAFIKRIVKTYDVATKKWTIYKDPKEYNGRLYEYKNGVFTGRFFYSCFFLEEDIINGWDYREPIVINCVNIQSNPRDFISIVDSDSLDLKLLEANYKIGWLEDSSIKEKKLEDLIIVK